MHRVLLGIALATAGCAQETPEVDNRYFQVRLPDVTGGVAHEDDLVVNVTADGRIMVAGQWMTLARLDEWLTPVFKASPKEEVLGSPYATRPVTVRADERAPWQHTATALFGVLRTYLPARMISE